MPPSGRAEVSAAASTAYWLTPPAPRPAPSAATLMLPGCVRKPISPRAFRQAGGAAGILQQRDVVGRDLWPLRRSGGARHECPKRHDRRIVRDRRVRVADPAPKVVP